MGQLISELAHAAARASYFDAAFTGPYPEESPVSMDDLEEHLSGRGRGLQSRSEARLEAARLATAELQAGRPGYRALWRHFLDVSAVGLEREFESLGVVFDVWKGESDVDPLIPAMIEDLKDDRLAIDGRRCADRAGRARTPTRRKMPPLILLKSDGAVLYGTTDLATIIDRVREHDPDLILYVVDQRQHGHFEQVFRAATKDGPRGKGRARTYRLRHGERYRRQAVQDARGRRDEALRPHRHGDGGSEQAPHRTGPRRRLSAKRNARRSPRRSASPRSNSPTSPTTASRTTSSISNASRASRARPGPICNTRRCASNRSCARREPRRLCGRRARHPLERGTRARAPACCSMPEALLNAEVKRAPNFLCDYAFTLAQNFSRFYTEHHIMSRNRRGFARRAPRSLHADARHLLKRMLGVLGIEVPERM